MFLNAAFWKILPNVQLAHETDEKRHPSITDWIHEHVADPQADDNPIESSRTFEQGKDSENRPLALPPGQIDGGLGLDMAGSVLDARKPPGQESDVEISSVFDPWVNFDMWPDLFLADAGHDFDIDLT